MQQAGLATHYTLPDTHTAAAHVASPARGRSRASRSDPCSCAYDSDDDGDNSGCHWRPGYLSVAMPLGRGELERRLAAFRAEGPMAMDPLEFAEGQRPTAFFLPYVTFLYTAALAATTADWMTDGQTVHGG